MRTKILAATLISLSAVVGYSTQATAYERWLRIHNNTDTPLCEVYIQNVGDNSWGPDRIGRCISPGRYRTVDPGYQQGYCKMDMQFVFDDGDNVEENNFDICLTTSTDYYLYNTD